MKTLRTFFVLVASLGAASNALAEEHCDQGDGILLSGAADAPWSVQVQLDPKDIPLNAPFEATVTICTKMEKLPARIDVDAVMPAHKHGMNYEPKTVQIDKLHYEVRNLVFHMPGVWRLEITAYEDGKPYRFTHDVQLR